jgi:hypothetical protein
MQETRGTNGILAMCLAMLLATLIVAAVVWSEYKTYHFGTWMALWIGGFLFWLIGLALIGRGAPARTQPKHEFTEDSGELCLREFYLNGHFFQPYEQAISIGQKKFRLLSTPPMDPDREAAVIRYLLNEGLCERMWPQISRRIEEEATWAFFP